MVGVVSGNATTAGVIGIASAGDPSSFTITPADRFGNIIKSGKQKIIIR